MVLLYCVPQLWSSRNTRTEDAGIRTHPEQRPMLTRPSELQLMKHPGWGLSSGKRDSLKYCSGGGGQEISETEKKQRRHSRERKRWWCRGKKVWERQGGAMRVERKLNCSWNIKHKWGERKLTSLLKEKQGSKKCPCLGKSHAERSRCWGPLEAGCHSDAICLFFYYPVNLSVDGFFLL